MLFGPSLYRNLLREARRLPDQHASTYYHERIRRLFRDEHAYKTDLQTVRKTKRAQQLLRHLQAANDGYLHAVTRVLETAYGVRGPQKHASLAPYLKQDQEQHTFSPPLAALVGSTVSHLSRAPSPAQLVKPPTMPERADPTSEEARLLGPLIPQRVKAIKRRWWNSQTGKIRAPVTARVRENGQVVVGLEQAHATLVALENGLDELDLERGHDRLNQLETNATVPPSTAVLPPKRLQTLEQRSARHPVPPKLAKPVLGDPQRRVFSPSSRNTKWHSPKQITARFMRRRAAELLANSPIVEITVNEGKKPHYEVVRSALAKGEKGRMTQASAEDLWWIEKGEAMGKAKGKKRANQ
ncbi:uncharacterized protein JCM15063_002872 [Sporobolomyces koalae]|uniref:uncharacterized protein n=1 Tax=Sporobolomyces koalae TaxID=500713 RepID=UPI00317DAD7C